jgi:hypothetical protein
MIYKCKYPFYANELRFDKGQTLTQEGYDLAVATGNIDNIIAEGLIPDSFLEVAELEAKIAELNAILEAKKFESESAESKPENEVVETSKTVLKAKK